MAVLPKHRFPQLQFLQSRGRAPVSWLVACILLTVTGWAHFTGLQTDESSAPAYQSATLIDGDLKPRPVPMPRTIEENEQGTVVTASATSQSRSLAQPSAAAEGDKSAGAIHTADERFRSVISGNWHDEYRGKRRLTVRDDGTGTMVVEPDGIGKKLFAAELTFELEWSIADGHVMMKMLRGEPKSKVQLILKLYGKEAEYEILEMSDDRMLLLDSDGKTRYDWRRPQAPASE